MAGKTPGRTEKMLAPVRIFDYHSRWMARCCHIVLATAVVLFFRPPTINAESGVFSERGLISGRVVDVANSGGIAGVTVEAFGLEERGRIVYSGESLTASDGTYNLAVPVGVYLVRAECDGCLPGAGRTVVYYRDRFDPLRGEPVVVGPGEIVVDIDFDLNLTIPGDCYLEGQVTDESSGEGLPEVVVTAIDYGSGRDVNSTLSNYDGEFRVENLPAGDYLLFFSGYHIIPYFFRATEFWQSAEVIHLEANFTGIQSDAITQDYGNLLLAISGRVESNSRAISAARVYAYPVGEDRPVAYAVTDDAGEYAIINGLVSGYYIVACDLYGYDMQVYPDTVYVDLMENPEAEDVDFALAPRTTGIGGSVERPEMIAIFQNYPNPFNAGTNIPLYSTYAGIRDVEISVYDILGRMVGRKRVGINPGMNYISWGLDDFRAEISSGIFFYRLSGQEESRRMIILK